MNKFIIQLLDSDDSQNYLLAYLLVSNWNDTFSIWKGERGRSYRLHNEGDELNGIRQYKDGLNKWWFVRKHSNRTYKFFTHVPGHGPTYY